MPLYDLNNMPTVTIDKDFLIKQGWVKRVDEQRNIGLGDKLGTRALAEIADDSYTFYTVIDWVKRDQLATAQNIKMELPSKVLEKAIANQNGKVEITEDFKEQIALAIQETGTDVTNMALVKTYLADWSHEDGKGKKVPINEANIRRIPVGLFRVLLYIVSEIHKGNFLLKDDPLLDT